MKQLTVLKSAVLLLIVTFYQTVALAQDNGGTKPATSVKTTTTEWYVQPWAWIAGGAVFILILVALLRRKGSSNRNTDKVTVTETVSRENDSA